MSDKAVPQDVIAYTWDTYRDRFEGVPSLPMYQQAPQSEHGRTLVTVLEHPDHKEKFRALVAEINPRVEKTVLLTVEPTALKKFRSSHVYRLVDYVIA